MDENILKAIQVIKNAKHLIAFTGAGISVERVFPRLGAKAVCGLNTTRIFLIYRRFTPGQKNVGQLSKKYFTNTGELRLQTRRTQDSQNWRKKAF